LKLSRQQIDDMNAKLDTVIDPAGDARGLPNEFYTDPTLFAFERDEVLANSWVAVAFASDVPEPGHASPVEFMGMPLLVLRNKENKLRVYHNVCSHRGMLLVSEQTRLRTVIRCPYHSWSYDLNGQLMSTPLIGGTGKNSCDGFDTEAHGLKVVRFAVWMDIVFVNLSGTGQSFDDYIAPLESRWAPFWGTGGEHKFSPGEGAGKLQLSVNCNWKLAIENYCEAYHLPWVHPTLNEYSPLDQHFNINDEATMAGQATHQYDLAQTDATKLPTISGWPTDRIHHAEYLALYPNTLLGLQADHAFAVIVIPGNAGASQERLQILYTGAAVTQTDYAASRDAVLSSWDKVFREDIFVVEGMQKGRSSPAYNGGVLTPVQDIPTRNFHSWVARQYKSALKPTQFK
jgi:choline monooxygenase